MAHQLCRGEGGQLISSALACSLPLILWRSSKKSTESCSSGTDALAPMSKRISTLLSPPLRGISGRESFKVPGRTLPFSHIPSSLHNGTSPKSAHTRQGEASGRRRTAGAENADGEEGVVESGGGVADLHADDGEGLDRPPEVRSSFATASCTALGTRPRPCPRITDHAWPSALTVNVRRGEVVNRNALGRSHRQPVAIIVYLALRRRAPRLALARRKARQLLFSRHVVEEGGRLEALFPGLGRLGVREADEHVARGVGEEALDDEDCVLLLVRVIAAIPRPRHVTLARAPLTDYSCTICRA